MNSQPIVATIIGARPQFVKAAPVSRALQAKFTEVIIHTGQHYDASMSDIFFDELNLRRPDHNLGIGGGSHGEQTGRMLIEIEKTLLEIKPDIVLVYGDTNSTLAGSLVAAKLHIPVAHIEAGLRSYNRDMPEEINRVVCDHLSDLLFCPTSTASENLALEGIEKGVHRVGDVMYDALKYNLALARSKSSILENLRLDKGKYALATIHRASNTDNPDHLRSILRAFGQLNTIVVFPVHPRTKQVLNKLDIKPAKNIRLTEPVGYLDMLALEENANGILTDSGGVQKEAYLVGVRCITLREETEWVETVDVGWNRLVGTNQDLIRATFETWHPNADHPDLYGDGQAAEQISQILADKLLVD
jgi:UDP-GlcNAc3NAcA epimerase